MCTPTKGSYSGIVPSGRCETGHSLQSAQICEQENRVIFGRCGGVIQKIGIRESRHLSQEKMGLYLLFL